MEFDVVCDVLPARVDLEDLFPQPLFGVVVGSFYQKITALVNNYVHSTPVVEVLEEVLQKKH